ncbi:hypothetical protein C8J44_0191 [Sphingomonas sp. PP-CE-3A-406]|uniref:hypothetical protein n=1 Tax=Sphingomonas sp. PP-CE-3A-406 TaxID=2135659 RepID=UPI000EF87C96|nr:hypothetical protein [Sphingomonas sp. PP-CE-3A-406]RMB54959.1 hypothetical protein C8J44_0191 [Sphingomonas sp. PP-CE-3A-406]
MDLWTFHRYADPRLCVDAIEHAPDASAIALTQGDARYVLALDDAASATRMAAELATLRDGGAPLWDLMREAGADGWGALGAFLDGRALIGEGHDEIRQTLAARIAAIDACIDGTIIAIRADLPANRLGRLVAHAAVLRIESDIALASATLGTTGDPFDADVQPNFHLGLIIAEFAYFRNSAPLTLIAAGVMLARIAGDDAALPESDAIVEALSLYDPRDLESHLWLIGRALADSTGDAALRFAVPPIPDLPTLSGLEFMRRVEMLTRSTLGRWGENPYVTMLDALGDRWSPLIAGPFIEQYHVTCRFVEIIAPNLSRRLIAPLRAMMFRYFGEEVGHEALESTTCETLGITQAALDRAVPLPLHFAFVDLLTLVAQVDPVTSCASVMVIEGVFGEPPKMSLRLASVARTNPAFSDLAGDHDELNEDLNHNSISRDAFEHIVVIPPATQARVMRRILFLLELNHRAWGGIADFYGSQTSLHLQGPLGRPLAPGGGSA